MHSFPSPYFYQLLIDCCIWVCVVEVDHWTFVCFCWCSCLLVFLIFPLVCYGHCIDCIGLSLYVGGWSVVVVALIALVCCCLPVVVVCCSG